MGHRPGIKGGYFPVPPVDSLHDIRAAMCGAMEQMGLDVEFITTRLVLLVSVKSVFVSTP